MSARIGLAAALLALASHASRAQMRDSSATRDTASLACQAVPASDSGRAVPRAARPAVLDTTIVLAIADRSWHADHYDGGVALGAGNGTGTRASTARWSACAGVAVHLGATDVALHNVRGTVHLHVDRAALDRAGQGPVGPRQPAPSGSTRDTSRTSPVVPPRR